MRIRLTTLLCLALWAMAAKVDGCGPFERQYLASDYFMFRACGDNMKGEGALDARSEQDRRVENCRAWSALTSEQIATGDIEEVVYRWDQSQMERLREAAHGTAGSYETRNAFAAWIAEHGDREVADFLLLAKKSERVRGGMTDPWYYPVKGDEPWQELHKIIDEARSYKGKRLRDRYALQAMRGLFYCHEYAECLNCWHKNKKHFKTGVIKTLALGYVAGSMYHVGEKEAAVKLYIEIGDLHEAYECSANKEDFNRWVYEAQPDNEILVRLLQAAIHNIERWQADGQSAREGRRMDNCRERYEKLYPTVQKVIDERRCKNMAPWYYAGAFVADKLDRRQEATAYIEQAKNSQPGRELAHSIRVLDTYLTVRYAEGYDQAMEKRMLKELRWLDNMIVENLDPKSRAAIVKDGFDNHVGGLSQYYWNDVMRKIVIGELVPLCIRSDYKTRALQYLNMADNRLFGLVTDVAIERWTFDPKKGYMDLPDTLMTVDGYRDYVGHHNAYDYSNDYFINLDSLGVRYVKNLCQRMEHPQSLLDEFLNERGYRDMNYLYDIVGTQLIAARRFGEAIEYLEKVDEAFNKSRNVYLHCNVDPFTLTKTKPDAHYRLHYAQEMYRIEQEMEVCDDPNEKARLMLKYSKGLINSVDWECWPLTSYYWGSWGEFPFYSTYQKSLIAGTNNKAREMKQKAFTLFTDDEAAAKAYYDWNMYKTAVKKYPSSTTAAYIRGHCDELRDYVRR